MGESVSTPITGATIWISPEATLTNAEVAQAWPERINDKLGVWLQLTEDGALKFARLTKAHIGGLTAMMMDGRIIVVTQIMAEITGRIRVEGTFTEEQARDFAEGITVRQNSAGGIKK